MSNKARPAVDKLQFLSRFITSDALCSCFEQAGFSLSHLHPSMCHILAAFFRRFELCEYLWRTLLNYQRHTVCKSLTNVTWSWHLSNNKMLSDKNANKRQNLYKQWRYITEEDDMIKRLTLKWSMKRQRTDTYCSPFPGQSTWKPQRVFPAENRKHPHLIQV